MSKKKRFPTAVCGFLAAAVTAFLPLVPPPAGAAPPPRTTHEIEFSGFHWLVVHSEHLRGPGPNVFDARNVRVDRDGSLVLQTALRARRWTSAHVFLTESLGYGTYTMRLAGLPKPMDNQTVFGFFTWDDDPAFANREIDIELSRWANPNVANLHFTVQPWDLTGRQSAAELDLSRPSTLQFVWTPEAVVFTAWTETEMIHEWRFPGSGVGDDSQFGGSAGPGAVAETQAANEPGATAAAPAADQPGAVAETQAADEPIGPWPFVIPPTGNERLGINLWLFHGTAPQSADSLRIEAFHFSPWDG